jgi:anti-sigma-K factor RskA
MANTSSAHPDFGELEAYRRGEAEAAIADHVGRCALCQLNLKELDDLATLVRDDAAALPAVPEDIDQRIVWNARQNAARVRRQRVRQRVQRWAIAASLLLAVGAVAVRRQLNRSVPQAKLDIVDALALARRLATGQPADPRYDVNHDGRVDDADVERITRQAVALGDA